MAIANVVRTPFLTTAATALAAVALTATACAGSSSSAASRNQAEASQAVSQSQLTSAEVTNVQFKLPAGYGNQSPPPSVATPMQKQMEDDQKYPMPAMETATEWRERYPFPARMLRDWKQEHPASAALLQRWEDEQPDHVRMLVRWAIANPYEPVGSFMLNRRGWEDYRAMRDGDPEAVDSFLAWCRAAPKAAEELISRSEGIGSVIALPAPRR